MDDNYWESREREDKVDNDEFRFGSPPEPVANPSAEWCEAYANWYYQVRGEQ